MNPLLQGDFDAYEKNPIKKLRRKIIEKLRLIRNESTDNDYYSINNFAYFHLIFSAFLVFIPFLYLLISYYNINNNNKINFVENIVQEYFKKDANNQITSRLTQLSEFEAFSSKETLIYSGKSREISYNDPAIFLRKNFNKIKKNICSLISFIF